MDGPARGRGDSQRRGHLQACIRPLWRRFEAAGPDGSADRRPDRSAASDTLLPPSDLAGPGRPRSPSRRRHPSQASPTSTRLALRQPRPRSTNGKARRGPTRPRRCASICGVNGRSRQHRQTATLNQPIRFKKETRVIKGRRCELLHTCEGTSRSASSLTETPRSIGGAPGDPPPGLRAAKGDAR
jgi:hypothetical protein